MNQRDISLERHILAAFKLAQDSGRLAVADHLLCALECLCGDACEGTAVGEAYRAICCRGSVHSSRRGSIIVGHKAPMLVPWKAWRQSPLDASVRRHLVANRPLALLSNRLGSMIIFAMTNWSLRQVFALLLTVFATIGMSASIVQASEMTVKMATASGMSVNGHGDCHDCGSGGSGKSKPMVCTVACVAPVSVAFPQVGQIIFRGGTKLLPTETALLVGSTSPPDPFPPRSI